MNQINLLFTELANEHKRIEAALDSLAESIASGRVDPGLFWRARELNAQHYRAEEKFLSTLHAHEPRVAAKLRSQHDEALEISARLEETIAAAQDADSIYLARRFVAIVQHNMIEEERDIFPLAERWFRSENSMPGAT